MGGEKHEDREIAATTTAASSADPEVGTSFPEEAVSGLQEELWAVLHSLFVICWLYLTLLLAPRTVCDPNVIS